MNGRLRSLLGVSPLDRASRLRHVAIVIVVVTAWAMQKELALSDQVPWILGLAAALNLTAAFLAHLSVPAGVLRWLSSAFGIGSWAALAFITGGVASPFVAGLWLEIIFSAVVFPPPGTLVVTVAAVAALWLAAALSGFAPAPGRLWLHTCFVVATGALTFLASKRWVQAERAQALRAVELGRRLRDLQVQLDSTLALGRIGEGMARFAHGFKNAVHSIRGFTSLIEAPQTRTAVHQEAIQGLRLAIDRLEAVALRALDPCVAASRDRRAWTSAAEVDRTLDEVVEEVGRSHRGIHWVKQRAERFDGVALSTSQLREILLVLVENAAEASGAAGEVVVQVDSGQGMFNLLVRDRGPGIAPDLRGRIFSPGATTKASGHGLGLFLARRLVESRGGRLTAADARGGGALFSVTLPLGGN